MRIRWQAGAEWQITRYRKEVRQDSRRRGPGRGRRRRPQARSPWPREAAISYAAVPSSEAATSATSVGVRPTRTPLLSSASALALAVPREPDTIAPA